MTATTEAGVADQEWWERLRDRRDAWRIAHPGIVRTVARVRAVLLWVGLVWIGVLLVWKPELRLGVRAWLGCLWLVVVWFLLLRTKTVTFSGYGRWFALSVVWSVLIGVVSALLSATAGGVDTDGAGIGIAAFTEEGLKLLPLAVLVLAAPRRTSRFAAADWLLLGLAGGAAFLAVEELLRRTAYETRPGGLFGVLFDTLFSDGEGIPEAFTRFGLGLLPREGGNEYGSFAGHFVATGTVAAAVALGIAIWRAGRTSQHGAVVRLLGVLLPVWTFTLAVLDHAGWNATAAAQDRWLDPGTSTAPLVLRLAWSLGGHGAGRAVLLLVLVVAVLLVDGHRLARADPALAQGSPRLPGPLGPVAAAGLALGRLVVQDLRVVIAAHARVADEPRRAAARRGRAAVAMCRTRRELMFELVRGDGPPRHYRSAAGAAAAALLVAALVLGPVTALRIGEELLGAGWLAGQLDGLASWWDGLGTGDQIAIGVGIAALVALSGGSLGLAFGLSGVATYALEHGHGAADLVRDPRRATWDYLTTTTPLEALVELGEFALTFAPGNFAGAAGGRLARHAATEYLDDPAAWRAARRGMLRDERGSIDLSAFRRVEDWSDPARRRQWVEARYADTNADMRRVARGSGDDLAYQVRTAGDHEIRLVSSDGTTAIWADGVHVDPDGVVAVDAKHVRSPGRSLYEGTVPEGMRDRLMHGFDEEMERYGRVLADPANPVDRLRLFTDQPAAVEFLEQRARSILGSGVQLEVVLVP